MWGADWSELDMRHASPQGVCDFNDCDGVTLSIPFGSLSKESTFSAGGFTCATGNYTLGDRLVGVTQDGCQLVLRGCISKGISRSDPGDSQETIAATTLFSAKHDYDESLPVVSAEIEVYGLQDWLGKQIVAASVDGVISIKDERVECDLPLFKSDAFSASIKYGLNRPKQWRDCLEVWTFALVSVSCPHGMTFDRLWHEVVWKTQSLLAFMYGFYPSVEALRVRFEEDRPSVNVYRQSYIGVEDKVTEKTVPVPFQKLGEEGLQSVASRWFELTDREERTSELLTTLLGGWTTPLEMPLLAASAMVETLGRVHEVKTDSKKEFKTIKEAILAAAPEDVRERLSGLLGMLYTWSYARCLEAVYQECGSFASWLIEDWDSFSKRQRDLRNNGAHALDGDVDVAASIDHYYALILLAYCWFLKSFGVSDEVIDHFENGGYLNARRNAVHERYRLREGDAAAACVR